MHNIKCGIISLFALLLGFILAYFLLNKVRFDPHIYHANTVGSQISQVNDIYNRVSKENGSFLKEQILYNKDILTVIDCGQLLRSLNGMNSNSDLRPFKDGVRVAWDFLQNNGFSKNDLVVCNGSIFDWILDQ